ncbi:MAG: sigma-70 family RNA polymerase sigma factor [Verrucomicrobia bacterium]|nr:sigma-70 family RNA polymerase sigma factor [Verrucomicrobiota bacterium]
MADCPKPSQPRTPFAATRWTVVLKAARGSSDGGREALARLCETYWYPLYAYVRRQGCSPHDAQDLTQEFFARLLEKKRLAAVHPDKGRFRSFLLASLKNFLSDERDRARAQKRGGGKSFIRLDERDAEGRYRLEPADNTTAEKIFERRWAQTLIENVLGRLREEYHVADKGRVFDRLKDFMAGETGHSTYANAAVELGTTEANVKVLVHRLRKHYRELLRAEIAQTVASPSEVEDEIRCLFAALGN